MALTLLALLVLLDAALSGFRAAAGLSARIDKRRYYAQALLRGALSGAALALVMASTTWVAATMTSEAAGFEQDANLAIRRLDLAFGPVAVVGVAVLLVRALPSVDLRSLASTLFFGPLTLLRPLVVALGAAWTLAGLAHAEVKALTLFACAGMLALGPLARLVTVRASSKRARAARLGASVE